MSKAADSVKAVIMKESICSDVLLSTLPRPVLSMSNVYT